MTATAPDHDSDHEQSAEEPHAKPTRIAVFGSLDAAPPAPLSPPARAVLDHVLEQVALSAPAIARPILDRAVADGAISRAQRHAILLDLDDPLAEQAPSRGVLREVRAAIRRATPSIARPILAQARASERLTAAQERRVLERLRSGVSRARHAGTAHGLS